MVPLKRVVLPLVLIAIFFSVLYGLGFPLFRKQLAPNTESQRVDSRTLAVEVGEVQPGTVETVVSAVGSLTASAYVNVAPKIDGRVEKVLVDVGDLVKAGQLIAQLDSRELTQEVREAEASLKVSQATLKGKEAELEDLQKKLERARLLYKNNFISRQELDTLESEVAAAVAQVELSSAQIVQMRARLTHARLQLAEAQVLAPFGGYVEKRLVDSGAMVNSGTAIASIVDIARVKVIVDVVEKEYPKILRGQGATISLQAFPGRLFRGKVVRKTPVLSEETRTGAVEIEVDNVAGDLKPGMFAKIDISLGQRRNVLLIPDGALVKIPEGYGVFRVRVAADNALQAEMVQVFIGTSRGGQTEVEGDLSTGDRVVTLGSSLLKSGQRVRVGAGAAKDRHKGAGT